MYKKAELSGYLVASSSEPRLSKKKALYFGNKYSSIDRLSSEK